MSSLVDSNNIPQESVLVSLMEDAIELMEPDETRPYLEAVRRCPQIVRTESDFVYFLRFEDYDIWKATKRLLKYWEWRIKMFGERAFLSMFDLTGNGAMEDFDLKVLATKAHVILPEDINGCSVFYLDRRRYGKKYQNLDSARFNRQIFFLLEYISHLQRHKGRWVPRLGIMILMSALPFYFSKNNSINLKDALTVKVEWFRHVIISKDKSQKVWFQAIFPMFQKMVMQRLTAIKGVKTFCEESEEIMKEKLVLVGLSEDGFPSTLGGTWSYDNFSVWESLPSILEKSSCCAVLLPVPPESSLPKNELQRDTSLDGQPGANSHSGQSLFINFLYSAEIEVIPFHEKISWINAQRNLQLVQKESFLSQFHSFHNGRNVEAAKHMFSYWAMREKVFSHRAFLDMNQVGSGALEKVDIENLQSGFLMLLPKDSEGNHVLYYNPSKLQKPILVAQRRILFYMLFLTVEQSTNASTKIKFLVSLNRNELQRKQRRVVAFTDVIKSFPLEIISYHIVLDKEGLNDETYRKQALFKVMSLFGCSSSQVVTHTILPGNDNILRDELSVYGIKPDNMPSALGGAWDHVSFLKWQDEMILHEAADRSQESFRDERNWKVIQRRLDQENPEVTTGEDREPEMRKRGMEKGKPWFGSPKQDGCSSRVTPENGTINSS